jgi:hypothetical protein
MRWVLLLGAWLFLSNTASAGMFGQFMTNGNAGIVFLTDGVGNPLLTGTGSNIIQ